MFGEEGIFLWRTAGAYMYPHEQLKEGLEEDDRVGQEMDKVEELLFPWRGPSVGCSRTLDVTNGELAGTASNHSHFLV